MTLSKPHLVDFSTLSRRFNIGSTRPKFTDLGLGPEKLVEQEDFGANPGALRMFVYVPDRLPRNSPLVVILHGCGQSASNYDIGAGWTALADETGFAVLAPQQSNANNINGCFNWFEPGDVARGHGEVASIRQMIARAVADHDLDESRIFITGLSAGGAMTAAMLSTYPEIFAGGAIIAGLPYGAASTMPEALSAMRHAPKRSAAEWGNAVRGAAKFAGRWPAISIWHGDADTIVNLSNGEAIAEQWRNVHGLTPAPSDQAAEGRHRRRTWKRPDGSVALETFTFCGMQHGTPLASHQDEKYGQHGPYFLDADMSSTARIAMSWNIVDEATVTASKRKHGRLKANATVSANTGHEWASPHAVKPGVKSVILNALRSAGLMKP